MQMNVRRIQMPDTWQIALRAGSRQELVRRVGVHETILKRLMELNAPDVIIKNAKCLVMQHLIALLDWESSRKKRPAGKVEAR